MNMSEFTLQFSHIFHNETTPRLFFAPGRINLIGEHTDYNGGHVFPAAISFGTYAAACKRSDSKLRFHSLNFPEAGVLECSLENLAYDDTHQWANYPKGMIQYMKEAGHAIDTGMDILYEGNIPNSAGLSSSASIEMVTSQAVAALFNLDIDPIDIALLGQRVENDYIGVNSGIMDQFAISMGKKDHAILLNTDTMEYDYAPIKLDGYKIIIMNTNKQRTLAGSKYNERRTECEQALAALQTELSITSLGQLSREAFDKNSYLIKDETVKKRARHAVYENARTLEALIKLKAGDLEGFGTLMNASHTSLQNDYEVTGLELDTLVHTAWEQPGVIGARMTGAGFGGCAIAIVDSGQIEAFQEKVNHRYRDTTGYDATFYIAEIGDGAKEMIKDGV
ncbi:galactokinase [Lentibacillus sp. JNUCC-1]|uniref:galactokinase n=1 Tax=Lentibacillus sp. JNUCC-1 TaxID=2654513 RepID=UPI0012E758FB|nr:galactokinase [Lentibacillus sp. JNUCC-1]